MADCLFCKIIERKIPSTVVYEDDRVLAFNDIDPQAPNTLIVPKRHIPTLNDIGTEDDQIVGELSAEPRTSRKNEGSRRRAIGRCSTRTGGAGRQRAPHPPAPARGASPRLASGLRTA